jgi:hypothetical protein
MTALKLISKKPLQVDQLDATKCLNNPYTVDISYVLIIVSALEISGEAVEAEFAQRLRSMISPRDYNGDLEGLLYHVCREFREQKKDCGQLPRPGLSTWNILAPGLRGNSRNGFERDYLKIKLYVPLSCADMC